MSTILNIFIIINVDSEKEKVFTILNTFIMIKSYNLYVQLRIS